MSCVSPEKIIVRGRGKGKLGGCCTSTMRSVTSCETCEESSGEEVIATAWSKADGLEDVPERNTGSVKRQRVIGSRVALLGSSPTRYSCRAGHLDHDAARDGVAVGRER